MIAQNLIVYGSFTTGTKTFFSGGQFGPDSTGQFRPDRGGQFAPDKGGQFKPDRGGQLHRIFQKSTLYLNCDIYLNNIDRLLKKLKTNKASGYNFYQYLESDLCSIKDCINRKKNNHINTEYEIIDKETQIEIQNFKKYFKVHKYKNHDPIIVFKELHSKFNKILFENNELDIINIFINNLYFDKIIWICKYKGRTSRKDILCFIYLLMENNLIENFWNDKNQIVESIATISNKNVTKKEKENIKKAYDYLTPSRKNFTIVQSKIPSYILETFNSILKSLP